jgi:hypothetical protein
MSDISPARQELDDLARRIRAALQASRADRCNALHRDLEVGEALIEAQKHVTTGWKRWLRENCSLRVRTAMLYMQLARHRAEIEAAIDRLGELSLRAAIRLISKKKPGERESTEPPPKPPESALLIAISKATGAELTEALIALSLDRFLQVMPAEWRPKLEARAGGQMISRVKERHPNVRLKHLDKAKLRIVGSTESSAQH